MSENVFKASVSTTNDPNVFNSHVRHFNITFDSNGKQGMKPLQGFLGSLGACESINATSQNKKRHYNHNHLKITLNNYEPNEVAMQMHFITDRNKDEIATMVRAMETHCAVYDDFVNSLPVKLDDVKKKP